MFMIIGGDGREYGPASADQIRAWIASGRANLQTQAKAVGSDEWRTLGDFPEFAPGSAEPPPMSVEPDEALADRGARLGAWFLDNVLGFLCCLPGILMVGSSVIVSILTGHGTEVEGVAADRLFVGWVLLAIGGIALMIVQIWLLTTRGQTVGKRVLGVRIVSVADNRNAGFVRAVVLRWFVTGLITSVLSIVPGLGLLFFLVDSLFIFRADRRCIHDLIAGTKVVKG